MITEEKTLFCIVLFLSIVASISMSKSTFFQSLKYTSLVNLSSFLNTSFTQSKSRFSFASPSTQLLAESAAGNVILKIWEKGYLDILKPSASALGSCFGPVRQPIHFYSPTGLAFSAGRLQYGRQSFCAFNPAQSSQMSFWERSNRDLNHMASLQIWSRSRFMSSSASGGALYTNFALAMSTDLFALVLKRHPQLSFC